MKVRSAALATLVALASSCAGAQEHVVAFDPGQHSAQVQQVRVDVVEARYAERQLTVACALVNEGETPVTLDRGGVLIDDDGLEIPATSAPGDPARIELGPGETTPITFTFPLAAHEARPRTLGLWVLDRGETHLPPLRVNVPGIRTDPA